MSWTSETNIKGPKGDKGDPGIQGPPGTSGTGTGNVTGPAGAVADRIAVYNGTTGTVIKDGGKTIAELGGSAASGITVTPAGNIAATNVQAALVELDNEKVAKAGDTMTGNLIVNKSNPSLALQKTASGQTNQLVGYNDVNPRWQVQMGDSVAESGSNAGSNFVVARYSDAGAAIDAPLAIARSTGVVDFKSTPTVNGVVLGSGGGTVYMQDTPPVGAPDKSMWFETDTGMLFGRYNDGNSAQWVHVPGGIADAVRYATAQTLTAPQQIQARANTAAAPYEAMANNNLLLNGGMAVSQEFGTTGTVVANNAWKYTVDMWQAYAAGNGAFAFQQGGVAGTLGISNFISLYCTTAYTSAAAADLISFKQFIEGNRWAKMRSGNSAALPVTISFWIWAPVTGQMSVGIKSGTAPARSYFTLVPINAANTWEYKTVTIPGCTDGTWPADTATGAILVFSFYAGASQAGTPNTWLSTDVFAAVGTTNFYSTTNNLISLASVVVTVGSEAPTAAQSSLMARSYADDLIACRRYWRRIDSYLVQAPYSGAGAYYNTVVLEPPMRATPVCALTASGGGSANITGTPTVTPLTSYTAFITATATAVGTSYYYANLTFNARL